MASIRLPVCEREARRFGLPLLTPATLRTTEAISTARAHGADVAVVVAYGLILPKAILEAFPLGAFNLHGSLLPRWRGAAPINRAIMAGDSETGVMVMKMEEGLDSGPIAMAERVPVPCEATAGDLHDRLARLGADLMLRALSALERGSLTLTPQAQAGITYAHKIAKEETRIGWARPWREVHNQIRGLVARSGAWFEIGGDMRVKVLRTAKGGLEAARHGARRPAHRRLRRRGATHPGITARRPPVMKAHEVPARHDRCCRYAVD